MNKRGISAVVASVLVILITVTTISIVWFAVMPMISDISLNVNPDLNLVSNKGYTLWDSESRLATVQVGRGVDESNVVGFDLVFSLEGNSVTHFVEDVPGINGEKVYYVNLSEYLGELDSIRIVPIFGDGIAGDVVSELKVGRIPKADIIELIEEEEIVAEDFAQPSGSGGGGGGRSGSGDGDSGGEEEVNDTVCNNGVIESGEVCDGVLLGSRTCLLEGFESGDLACLSDCSGYNTSECVGCTNTCSSLGYECEMQDVCGVSTDCGTCGGGEVCSSGSCIVISGDVNAVIDVFNPQGLAPYTVLFNGFESSSPGREIMDYVWDFNDQNSQYERYDTGRMAGHRFDDPGTYIVYLTATDETGASSVGNISIEVLDNPIDAEVYYVANGGDDANSGLCEIDDGNGCGPWATFGRVTGDGASIPEGSDILFNRGETFNLVSTNPELFTTSVGSLMRAAPYYITIGAYGFGDKPTLDGGLDTGYVSRSQGINIEDIHLTRNFISYPIYPFTYPGHQGAIRNSVIDNGVSGWTTSGVSLENVLVDGAPGGSGPDFQDYSEFIYWNNVTILNTPGHGVYFASELSDPAAPSGKILIENSEFAYNGVTGPNLRDAFTIHGFTDNFIFRNNDVHHNGFALGWDSGYSDYYQETPEFNRNFILEDSRIHDQVYYTTQFNSHQNLIIRNNIFYNNPSSVIQIGAPQSSNDEASSNIRIYNNVLYNNRNGYQDSLFYFDSDRVYDVYVYNNIIYDNYGMDYILEDRDSSDLTISNNLYYNNAPAATDFRLDFVPRNFSYWLASGPETGIIVDEDPMFVDAAGGDFRLQVGSPAIDSGFNVSSILDIEGNARPQGLGWDIGAYEYV